MTLGHLDLGANVGLFFRELVENTASREDVDSSDWVLQYVACLLAAYVRPTGHERQLMDEPLTLALHRATHAPYVERFDRLRSVGDTVLYASGFFAEHLAARGVDLRYVRGLGARAYDLASSSLPSTDAPEDIFRDLSDRFDEYARLLAAVNDALVAESAANSPEGTLALYERWLKSRSPAVYDALVERGMIPMTRGRGTLH